MPDKNLSMLDLDEPIIDQLKEGEVHHTEIVEHVMTRVRGSRSQMECFYPRWRNLERKMQAYMLQKDWKALNQEIQNSKGLPPAPVAIHVPYMYATLNTIVAYFMHVFTGRRPIFPIHNLREGATRKAQIMEQVLQFNADHIKLVPKLKKMFTDAETYGVGILRTMWVNEVEAREFTQETQATTEDGLPTEEGETQTETETREITTFQGTEVENVDPFQFYPDYRFPMSDVARRGEFVFWRTYEGRYALKLLEKQGVYAHIDAVPKISGIGTEYGGESVRNERAYGISNQEDSTGFTDNLERAVSVIEGTIEIVPREFGFGESEYPEKWLIAIGNEKQIIKCEPFTAEHGEHPIVVTEPHGTGYGFGSLGVADMLGPIQDMISWFYNSRVASVRTSLGGTYFVNPSLAEVSDIKVPKYGGRTIVRMKSPFFGQDMKNAIQKLDNDDPTINHIRDMQLAFEIGARVSAADDAMQGLVQKQGNPPTATEVRTTNQMAASRIAAEAKVISSQAIHSLVVQMVSNYQQYLDTEFFIRLETGNDVEPINVDRNMVSGEYTYPPSDGTMPNDRGQLVELWKELFTGLISAPELALQFDLVGILEYIAKISGIDNLTAFKIVPTDAPPEGGIPMKDAVQQMQRRQQ